MASKKREILGEITQSKVKGKALVKAIGRLATMETNEPPKKQPVKTTGTKR